MRFRNDKRQRIKSFSFFSNNIKPREKMKRSIICKKFLDLFLMEEGEQQILVGNNCLSQYILSAILKLFGKCLVQCFGTMFL